ncbi:hypothetical protein LJK88_47520 [Paenibacillus sp. P26]|nr:hypothetical protein LJK88_47520 [Paenibacillus sp. P26]
MSRKISMSAAINEAMKLAMRKDEDVILMGRTWPEGPTSTICRTMKPGAAFWA